MRAPGCSSLAAGPEKAETVLLGGTVLPGGVPQSSSGGLWPGRMRMALFLELKLTMMMMMCAGRKGHPARNRILLQPELHILCLRLARHFWQSRYRVLSCSLNIPSPARKEEPLWLGQTLDNQHGLEIFLSNIPQSLYPHSFTQQIFVLHTHIHVYIYICIYISIYKLPPTVRLL